ncbi:amidohydrolase family protein [Sphingomonas sp. MMS24-JH45]
MARAYRGVDAAADAPRAPPRSRRRTRARDGAGGGLRRRRERARGKEARRQGRAGVDRRARPAGGPRRALEMWSFVRGGWSPIEALRAGTIMPATSLGYQKDVGSLEPGELRDLVVLDADPTVDIRNTEKVNRVMLAATCSAGDAGDEVATGSFKRMPYWWEGAAGGKSTGVRLTTGHGHGDWAQDWTPRRKPGPRV